MDITYYIGGWLLTCALVAVGLIIGYYIGRRTVDHEMHTELCRYRQGLPDALMDIRRKTDRALDAIKVIELRLNTLENDFNTQIVSNLNNGLTN